MDPKYGMKQDLHLPRLDEAYVWRLRERDEATEAHFVAYFGTLLQIKIRMRPACAVHVEDVRREIVGRVLAAIRSETGVRHPERLGAFVNSVCNDVLHQLGRLPRCDEPMKDLLIEPANSRIDPQSTQDIGESGRRIRQVLSQLRSRDRQILRAVLVEERSKHEICENFGVNRDYLRILLRQAKQQFLKLYHPTEHRRFDSDQRPS